MNLAQRAVLAVKLLAVAEAARQLEDALLSYGAENQVLLDSPEDPGSVARVDQLFHAAGKSLSSTHPGTGYVFTTNPSKPH